EDGRDRRADAVGADHRIFHATPPGFSASPEDGGVASQLPPGDTAPRMRAGHAQARRLAMAVVGLLVLAGSAHAGPASESDLDLRYDVYYSLLRVLRIESRSRIERDAYDVHSTMETVGLVGSLFSWSYRSEVQGRIDGGRLTPDRFQSRSEYHGKVQQVELRYEGKDPVVDKLDAFTD